MKDIYLLWDNGVIVGWSETTESDLPPVSVEDNHDFFNNPSNYKLLDGRLVNLEVANLEYAKRDKFDELRYRCENSILGYFKASINGIEYDFSFDREAQMNFTGTLALFTANLIADIEWTVWRNGVAERIIINKNQFIQIISIAMNHKNAKIARLRSEMQSAIEQATTIEEIMSIRW